MNELFTTLQLFLPLLGQMAHHEKAAALAQELIRIGEEQASRVAAQRGQTREQVLADAAATWDEAIKGAEDLKKLGHE